MTYPKTWLIRPVRRGIMITLIALFFIISPAIILYTAGYRYDVAQGRIKQTGVVSVDIQPSDSRVYLNNILIKKKMPIRLTNRAPGTYQVRIEREGYHTWLQDITVDSNQTTYIKDIALFAQTLPIRMSDERSFIDTAFSFDGSFFLATTLEDDIYSTILYSTLDDSWTTISRTADIPLISWSPYHETALIKTVDAGVTHIERLDPIQKKITHVYQFPSYISDVQWNRHRPTGYVSHNDSLYSLGSTKKIIGPITSSIWFVDDDEKVWIVHEETRTITNGAEHIQIPRDVSILDIVSVETDFIIAQALRGVVIIQKDSGEATTIPAREILFDTDFERWIVWSPIEIWTIHKDGKDYLEDRLSNSTITDVLPLNTFQSLLYSTGVSIEAVNPGYSTHHQLFADIIIDSLAVNKNNSMVYFFGTVGSQKGVFALPLRR